MHPITLLFSMQSKLETAPIYFPHSTNFLKFILNFKKSIKQFKSSYSFIPKPIHSPSEIPEPELSYVTTDILRGNTYYSNGINSIRDPLLLCE